MCSGLRIQGLVQGFGVRDFEACPYHRFVHSSLQDFFFTELPSSIANPSSCLSLSLSLSLSACVSP